jgi:hypothetical protein
MYEYLQRLKRAGPAEEGGTAVQMMRDQRRLLWSYSRSHLQFA